MQAARLTGVGRPPHSATGSAHPPLGRRDEPLAFGRLLRRLRVRACLTQEVLAERAGVSVATIGALEQGRRRRAYPITVAALAEALGLAADERAALVAGVPPPEVAPEPPAAGLVSGPPPRLGEEATGPTGSPELPNPLTPLLGREDDVALTTERLRQGARLLTLTGPGGVGKTRLALQITAEMRGLFADDVAFVPLGSLGEAKLVLPTVAQILGVRETGGTPLGELLQRALRDRHLLLVLDNCEHVLAGVAKVTALLEGCPRLVVLATSRAPLRVRGEQEYPVAPLALPTFDRQLALEEAAQSPAVRLFVERARAASPAFMLSAANVSAVAAICGRLDGLPLALELAAPRVKLLPPQLLLARLHRALPLLTGGGRDLPARQRTLRDTIAWSYVLLAPADQALLRQLAVFADGCTLEAAEAVCGDAGGSSPGLLAGVTALVEASLLAVSPGADWEPRYRLLETIGEYALEQLEAGGEADEWRRRHAEYFLDRAEQAEPELRSADKQIWLDRLDRDLGNLRAALAWAATTGKVELGVRLALALAVFWEERGHTREGCEWLQTLAQGRADPAESLPLTALRARALATAARLACHRGDYQSAAPLAQLSLSLWRQLGQPGNSAEALTTLAFVAGQQGNLARQLALFQKSLALHRAQGDTRGMADVLSWLGRLRQVANDLDGATALVEEVLGLYRDLGDTSGTAFAMAELGSLAAARQDYERAQALFEQSLTCYEQLGDSHDAAYVLCAMAGMAADRGELERAVAFCDEGLARFRQLGEARGLVETLSLRGRIAALRGDDDGARAAYAECMTLSHAAFKADLVFSLEGLAQVVARQAAHDASRGQMKRAIRLFGAGAALRASLGAAAVRAWATPLTPVSRDEYEHQVMAARTALGEDAFNLAWLEGQRLPMEQAVAEAFGAVWRSVTRTPLGAQ